MKQYEIMEKVTTNVIKCDYDKLVAHCRESGLPRSRLVAIALHNELMKDEPFSLVDSPSTEYEEFKYADEAGKLLDFIRKFEVGLTFDVLYMSRDLAGIPNADVFLEAWRELLKQDVLESFKPNSKYYPNVHDDYLAYTVKGNEPNPKRVRNNKSKRYEQYQKLKKEFGKK